MSSALRLSAADAMHRTSGARSSSSGVPVTADGSTVDGMGSLMNSRKLSVRASAFLDFPCDMERDDILVLRPAGGGTTQPDTEPVKADNIPIEATDLGAIV